MSPEETGCKSSPLDKPLYQLTEDDISQLTREDCRCYLKQKGMRRPSWNKSQAIQQVISLKALFETTPDTDAGTGKTSDIHVQCVQRGKDTAAELSESAEETVPDGKKQQGKPDISGHITAPPVTAVDKSAPSRTIGSADTPAGQMIIFYSGKVNVYDDVPANKAQTIMCLASGPHCMPSEAPSNATLAARHSACCLQAANTKLRPDSDMVPTIQTEAVESPASGKASVQRYLEKRKDRLSTAPTASCPVQENIQMNPTFSSGINDREFTMVGEKVALLFGAFLCSSYAYEVSVSCMMAYDEGGASAVFNSPECPRWDFSAAVNNETDDCLVATHQGRRKYQEDRIRCYPHVTVPVLGEDGPNEAGVGIAAVFDGHGGKEASEMASQKFLDYFLLHVVFNTYKNLFSHSNEHEEAGQHSLKFKVDDESTHGILAKALLRTIQDIDSEFSQEALKNDYISGSTAIVVLWMNGQILVGNLGDSKALLCSRKTHFDQDSEGELLTRLQAEELTRDHYPDRDDEKARIEAAGGVVLLVGVPRVNGILAVSRSIGDIRLKRYGIVAEPEVTGWRRLSTEDRYVVIGSDGIYERTSPQDVCNILHETSIDSSSCPSSSSLADCIVHNAFSKGSSDNLSVIVIPLRQISPSLEHKEQI
ncbi:probable protein phosphatase 2C 51 isoform X2 [Lycium barbarum]|uniref:probable protein phosphatase 2C 51 isoform X2 n=1 Tax=Lycium barbarum TaxID=112863 RepID=UPI00293ED449|nr:probable protein phosphatase 2C 51 isoform X2 [Lycium barbarum]